MAERGKRGILLTCVLFSWLAFNVDAVVDFNERSYKLEIQSNPFASFYVDSTGITTSGVSSGGAMASQLHFAHSSVFSGAGILSGVPYWCAADNLAVALSLCMKYPALINTAVLYSAIEYAATMYSIDDPSYLKNSKVYIFQGTDDSVVVPGVGTKVHELYKYFIPATNVIMKNNIKAEHAIITNNWGNKCSDLGSPYINNCHYDTAGALLNWFYGNLTTPSAPFNKDNLIRFDQSKFMPPLITPASISMAGTGYVYIPTGCNNTKVGCRLHVALHGCSQYVDIVGQDFVLNAGYNSWAEVNNIIVLYPQTIASNLPYNPDGCWDWFAYTGPEYATKLAPQIIAIMNMITAFGKP